MENRCSGGGQMAGKIVLGAFALLVIAVGVMATPDLIRYMKIRSM
jgi:hypothetical protein